MAKKTRHPWLWLYLAATGTLCVYGELWARSEKRRFALERLPRHAPQKP